MATYSMFAVGRRYLEARSRFLALHPHPWLVWAPPKRVGTEPIMVTGVRGGDMPELELPEAMEVAKGEKPNAFPFGITIGHSENNDVVLRHEQVSRFHAYIFEKGGKRFLCDAASKNGSFVDGKKLTPSVPEPLPEEAIVRFGDWELRYFEPLKFIEYLDSH